ncbi:unnamed protein product [Clavelina lepadiformis]|uniref:G-protein coupled receptors family 1 profile domain-containing protein n=1 Tax=Clavelina lepadiformis TaxID=159417 RepID=A0ABP0EUR6_CLALP
MEVFNSTSSFYDITNEIDTNYVTSDFRPEHKGTSPATYTEQIAIATMIAIFGIWSTFGNLVTILAIALHRGMRTKCNLFILSLALSDLISGVVASPLWLYRRTWGFYDWEWGEFLCKLFWFTDESTSYCTALHIASFAVWRLIGVKWPLRFEAMKRKKIAIWLLTLWLVSIIFGGFVFSYFYEVAVKGKEAVSGCWPMCSIRLSHHGVTQHRIYYTFTTTSFLLFPMLVLFASSLLLVKELYFLKVVKSANRRKKEKKAAVQLALISTSFLIGYIPMSSYVMWTTRVTHKYQLFDYWFHVTAYFCLRFSECLNPVMYNLASTKMKEASKDVLWTLRTCRKSSKEIRSSRQEISKNPGSPIKLRPSQKDQLFVPVNDVTRSIF